MKDKYFDKKAIEIRNKIYDAKNDNKKITFGDIDNIIADALKKVANDQKKECINACKNTGYEFEIIFQKILENLSK